ncbi:MAG TPA: hypothetical protein VMT30_08695 [Candidatus Saccharimonadia bacterium]|nr:hypothetical protein [Candidatus Saccharimonadia bacterium]
MNRKTIIAISAVAVGAIALFAVSYRLSLKTVTLNITQPNITITINRIDKDKSTKTASLTATGNVSLSKGTYTAVPAGTDANTTPIPFTVGDNNLTLEIHPGYSNAYLAKLLSTQQAAITAIIAAAYPKALTGFKRGREQLYKDGDWYGTTLIQNPPHPKENGDVYRLVLHRENGQWKIATPPRIILSAKEFPAVPIEILRDIDQPNN